MSRTTKYLVALFVFIVALIYTISLGTVIVEYNIPVSNLGVVVTSLVPIGMFATAFGIVLHIWMDR